MRTAVVLSLLLGSLMSSGCSDDGGSSGSTGSQSSAPAKCREYIDAACTYVDRCEAQDKATCVTQSSESIACDKVVQVTSNYDKCLSELEAAICPAAGGSLSLPAVCKGIILLDSGAGGSGGGSSNNGSAVTKCNQLTEQICTFADGCKLQGKSDCLAESSGSLPCDRAADVSATYDQCVADVDALGCPASVAEFKLPSSCSGAIKLTLSGPPGGQWQSLVTGGAGEPSAE